MRYDKIIRRIKYLYWILVQPIGVRTHVYGIRSVVQSVLRLTVARQRTLEHTFKLQRKIASTMMTMPSPALLFLLASVLISSCQSFISISTTSGHRIQRYQSSAIDSEPLPLNVDDLEDLKSELVRTCKASPKPSLDLVRSLVQQVEGVGEQLGIGQSSSSSGLLSGEW